MDHGRWKQSGYNNGKVKHDSKINGYGNLGKMLVYNKGYSNDAVWWKSSKNKNVENADVLNQHLNDDNQEYGNDENFKRYDNSDSEIKDKSKYSG